MTSLCIIYYNCFKDFSVNFCLEVDTGPPFHQSVSLSLTFLPLLLSSSLLFLLTMMEFLLILAYQVRNFHPCFQSYYHIYLMHHFLLSCIGEGNGIPLQRSCLENPKDGGAWWAAIYGVTQSWTQLKRLSSSSSSSSNAFILWKI